MVRLLVVAVSMLALTTANAAADPGRAGTPKSFVDRHHCQITARLQTLYAAPDKKPHSDRFIILALKYSPFEFVQCLFEDDNSELLCEASSGFYTAKPGEPRTYKIKPEGLTELKLLGFSDDDTKGNYSKYIKLTSPSELPAIATLMLTALSRGYGANMTSELEIVAPRGTLAREDDVKCTPLS